MQTTRPFPGIDFRAETPTTVDLPRMDIAAFVGFAQRGPVHVPVVVEGYADFVDLFGGSYRLAWDAEEGLWQTACLAPAVKAFFTQGGQRCWVVRVANQTQAVANQFPLAGLLQTNGKHYSPVVAKACSVGSWSDDFHVKAEPQLDAMAFATRTVQPGVNFSLSLTLPRNQELQLGDLLRLDFSDQLHHAYVVIGKEGFQVDQGVSSIKVHSDNSHWFCTVHQSTVGVVEAISRTLSVPIMAKLTKDVDRWVLTQTFSSFVIKYWFYLLTAGFSIHELIAVLVIAFQIYDLVIAFQIHEPGDWLKLNISDREQIWLLVKDVEAGYINLQGAWLEGGATVEPLTITRVQRVQIALNVRGEPECNYTLQNLACAAPHPRFIGSLPNDERLYATHIGAPQPLQSPLLKGLWKEVQSLRFPIALQCSENITIIPLGLNSELPSRCASTDKTLPLVRDGLVPATNDVHSLSGSDWNAFWPGIFLDQSLRSTGQRSLLNEANNRLYIEGKPLTGIHALLPIEEASIIALPDAAHPGWQLTQSAIVQSNASETEPESPDPCAKSGPFRPCENSSSSVSSSTSSNSSTPTTSATQWQLLAPKEFQSTGLLEVQQATACLAAARGDLVAVLGMPKHYRLSEALEHQRQLLNRVRREGDTTDSYIAIYHPWLINRGESGELIHTHPAGNMAGVMASRSLNRGAWIAPANEVLQDTLATLPLLRLADEQALYAAGINPIRKTAQGFVAWGGYTQSSDPDLEDFNVRRLLILLRRLALREGQTYVFAPHSNAFRRRIKQQFEQVLARLFERGAFAGRIHAEAYQVVIDDTLNRQSTIEKGQLIVELRVAPSQPLTFMTVRLVQSESHLLTVQEVRTHGS